MEPVTTAVVSAAANVFANFIFISLCPRQGAAVVERPGWGLGRTILRACIVLRSKCNRSAAHFRINATLWAGNCHKNRQLRLGPVHRAVESIVVFVVSLGIRAKL